MNNKSLKILQICTSDSGGGAEKVAWDLFQSYKQSGYKSWLAVGYKYSNDKDVIKIPDSKLLNYWGYLCLSISQSIRPLNGIIPGISTITRTLDYIKEPKRHIIKKDGSEYFEFPGTKKLLDITPERPDIIHCHNLHGNYFDLRVLPWLCQQVPVMLTLHDAWMLSGHCAHSFSCDRWKNGCGNCPDLTIYPAIKKDATSNNWKIKKEIFSDSRFFLSTPSKWLMDKVEQSIMASSIIEAKVIPNGVNLDIFKPFNKNRAREILGLPKDAKILLFTANGIRNNIWKDYKTLRSAVSIVADLCKNKKIIFLALGENSPPEVIGNATIQFIPFQKDLYRVAKYYQAADVYIHAARADTFPNVILEALACGTPVVATAVGGIPEQIEDGRTGFLTPVGDAKAMAIHVTELICDENRCDEMSTYAYRTAKGRYDIVRQVNEYLSWYHKIIK